MKTETFCEDTGALWAFAGTVLKIFLVVIPAIVVIWGVIYLGKAVISDDDKAIGEAWKKLLKKIIVAVCIFFVPTLVLSVFNLVSNFSGTGFNKCIEPLTFGGNKNK